MSLGNFTDDATFDFKFMTRSGSIPTSLLGSPVISIYPNNSVTQITAGITLTVDFDGVVGLNHVRVDLSASASYVPGADYDVVITAGTVDGASAIGHVESFSIQHQFDALNVMLADSIPADGTRPTPAQALYMLTQFMLDRSVSGVTCTVKKVDGTTALFTLTLDDAVSPTSVARAT